MVDRYEDIADEFILSTMQTVLDLATAMCKAMWAVLKQVTGHPALFVPIGCLGWLWWAQGRGAVIVSVVMALAAWWGSGMFSISSRAAMTALWTGSLFNSSIAAAAMVPVPTVSWLMERPRPAV